MSAAEYWPLAAFGAVLVAPALLDAVQKRTQAPALPPDAVAVVDGVQLQPDAGLRAALAALPARIVNIAPTVTRRALADVWPRLRATLLLSRGRAEGCRATQPALAASEAAEVVSALLVCASRGMRAAGFKGGWNPFVNSFGIAQGALGAAFVDEPTADGPPLSDLGNAYRAAFQALGVVANPFGVTLTQVHLQRATDLAEALAEACDESSYGFPISFPSVLDSLAVGVTSLPDTLANAGGAALGVVEDIALSAVGSVVFSTPVLIGALAFAWWRLS